MLTMHKPEQETIFRKWKVHNGVTVCCTAVTIFIINKYKSHIVIQYYYFLLKF